MRTQFVFDIGQAIGAGLLLGGCAFVLGSFRGALVERRRRR